jgi:hypothetical protein
MAMSPLPRTRTRTHWFLTPGFRVTQEVVHRAEDDSHE